MVVREAPFEEGELDLSAFVVRGLILPEWALPSSESGAECDSRSQPVMPLPESVRRIPTQVRNQSPSTYRLTHRQIAGSPPTSTLAQTPLRR